MIARGTAALFAHLVHYRQFRFLWAISPTRDKCGMGLQQWKALWLPPSQNDSRCWTAYYPAIGISNWGWYGNVLCLLCFQHTKGLPDTPESQGMRLGRLSTDSGAWFCSSICLSQMRLPSISLLSSGCSPNAWPSATPSFATVVEVGFNCYPQTILSNCQIGLQVRLNLYHTNPIKT